MRIINFILIFFFFLPLASAVFIGLPSSSGGSGNTTNICSSTWINSTNNIAIEINSSFPQNILIKTNKSVFLGDDDTNPIYEVYTDGNDLFFSTESAFSSLFNNVLTISQEPVLGSFQPNILFLDSMLVNTLTGVTIPWYTGMKGLLYVQSNSVATDPTIFLTPFNWLNGQGYGSTTISYINSSNNLSIIVTPSTTKNSGIDISSDYLYYNGDVQEWDNDINSTLLTLGTIYKNARDRSIHVNVYFERRKLAQNRRNALSAYVGATPTAVNTKVAEEGEITTLAFTSSANLLFSESFSFNVAPQQYFSLNDTSVSTNFVTLIYTQVVEE